MISRPDKPKRDELAQEISFWDTRHMKQGAKALNWFLDAEKKGASKKDLFHESTKFTDPDSGEVGMYRNAGNRPGFEMADEDVQIKPEVASHFDPFRGGQTPKAPLEEFIDAPRWFERDPSMRKVRTQLTMPERTGQGEKHWPGEGAYTTRAQTAREGGGAEGLLEVRPNAEHRSLTSRKPFSMLDLIGHEGGGHAVQDRNQMFRGDSPKNHLMKQAFNNLVLPRAKNYNEVLMNHYWDHLEKGMSNDEYMSKFPEASEYLTHADRLSRTSKNEPNISSLSPVEQYENVEGEEAARVVAERMGLNVQERLDSPQLPWMPQDDGPLKHAPYELQLLRTSANNYAMPEDRGTLARLMRPAPLAASGGASAALGLPSVAGAAEASPEPSPATPAPIEGRVEDALSRARANSARADEMATGAEGPRVGPMPPSMGDLGMDVLKSGVSAGRNVVEGTAGMVGDFADLRQDLTKLINETGQSHGSSIDQSQGLEAWDEMRPDLIGTSDVHGATERGLDLLPAEAKLGVDEWTMHQPETPWGEAAALGVEEGFDPLNWLTGGAGKGLRIARRAAR